MFKRSWVKLFAILALFGLLAMLLMPVIARADGGDEDFYASAILLNKYGLVQGDERGLRFHDSITRAEIAKLLVLSLGLEAQVNSYSGRDDFWDTKGHWAEAYIAVAKQVGVVRGYPEGDFRPQSPVSYAEVITALSRLVGLEAGREPWPFTYLTPARDAGIIPVQMSALQDLNGAAIRGDVFILLKRTVADVTNYAGQTLLQRYLDRTPPEITLDPQPTQTQSARLTVTGTVKDGERVRINGAAAAVEFGYFQHELDLRLGPNTIRVQAWDAAGNLAEAVAQVTRELGSATAIEFTGPKSLPVGQTAQYRLVLRDRNGEEIGDRAQVEVTVAPEIGQFDPLTGRFTAAAVPGEGTITLWAGSAQASLTVAVTAGELSRIALEPSEIPAAPGDTIPFAAIGYDERGNTVDLTSVAWSATGGVIDNQGAFLAPEDQDSEITVTATSGGKSASAIVHPVNYLAASVSVTAPASLLRANGISESTLTATVYDAAGNVLTDYHGTLSISSSAPGTVMVTQSTVPAESGVAAIPIRVGAAAGTAVITATTNLGTTGKVTVTVSPQLIQSVRLTGAAQPTADGNTVGTLEAQALDQDGNPLLTPLNQTLILTLTLSPAGGGVFVNNGQTTSALAMGAVDPGTGDVRARTQVLFAPGSGTLTITGTAGPDNLAYVRVLAGAMSAGPVGGPAQVRIEPIPYTLAGEERQVYVNIVDANGFRVTTGLTGYNVQLRDQHGVIWTPLPGERPADLGGRAILRVTQVQAGNYTYTAHLTPGGSTAAYTAQVVPGPVAALVLTATPDVLPADNSSRSTLKAELQDVNGNRVTAGSYSVTFSKDDPLDVATQPFVNQTVSSVGGVAQVTVTAGSVVGASDDYTASVPVVDALGAPQAAATVAISTQGAPQRLTISYGDNDGDGVSGGVGDHQGTVGLPLTVEVQVTDAFGNVVSYESGRQITLTALRAGTEISGLPGATVDGKATFLLNHPAAGSYALKAESAGLMRGITAGYGGVLADAVLRPGLSTALQVTPDLFTLKADGGKSYSLIAVELLDASGNVTANQTGLSISVEVEIDRPTYAYGFFTINDHPAAEKTKSRTVVILPGASASAPIKFYSGSTAGSTKFEASAADGGSASATVSTKSMGTVSSVEVDDVQTVQWEPWANADSAATGQTVVVTAVDSSGNRVTDYGYGGETLSISAEGDARIVAVYDRGLRTWRTLDANPGDGVGDYPPTYPVPADRGEAIFRVRAGSPGTKVYRLGYGANTAVTTETGRFESTMPDYLTVQADRRRVAGGGSQVTIQARVRDPFGNTLDWVTGPIQFSLSTAAAGNLITSSAELVGGVATVHFQSALIVSADTDVTVFAQSNALVRPNGGLLAQASDQFTVDETPQVTGLTAANGGGTAGVVDAGDRIVITFSEAIDGATVLAELTAGGAAVVPVGVSSDLDPLASAITFDGLPGLGRINLPSGALVTANAYAVAAISLDAAGQVLTVTLGDRQDAAPDTQVVIWNGAAASVIMNGAIRDAQGSGAFGPFPVTPLNGDF